MINKIITELDPNLLQKHDLNKKIFGNISIDEKESLKSDIANRGIQDPLQVVKQENKFLLLSGYRRAEIAKELNIKVPCIIRTDIKEDWQIVEFLIKDNLLRRHLNDYQKMLCGLELEPIERLKAKERERISGILYGENHYKDKQEGVQNFAYPLENGQSRSIIAKKVGFGSGYQYDKAKKVYSEAPEFIRELWQDGKITTHTAFQKIKRNIREVKVETPELPEGKFNVIYADPPWKYDFSRDKNRSIESHYPTMELEEICDLKIPFADDSILFLWATAPKLREAFAVIDSWEFIFKTSAVWVKDKIGMGYYFRNQHEILLVSTKGNISPPKPEDRISSVIESPRDKHSKKPEKIYEIIERMYPYHKYLELFARNSRDNWTSWGFEIEDRNESRLQM